MKAQIKCAYSDIWPITKPVEHPKNPNKHTDSQLALLGRIIVQAGWRRPIVVSSRSGFITKGHGRFMAARIANLEEVPIEIQQYASEREELADLVADNRLSELSEVDQDALKLLLTEISASGLGLDMAGFTEKAFAELAQQNVATTPTRNAPKQRKIGARVIQYNLLFDTEQQQQQWFAYLRSLQAKYPTIETIGERIVADISS